MTEMPPSIVLNAGQQVAADGFFDFLFTDAREIIISGPAGTGKTFLMGQMIDVILPMYFQACQLSGIPSEFDEVVMTASTNKATDVLAAATSRPCQTIYSFMNLTVKDDYKTGKSTVTPTGSWVVHHNKIIFIDEYTMIDTPALNKIREGTHKCKIIWVGDHCQLPPVMEASSPVHRQGDIPVYELTEPMRNSKQPALVALCDQLRETVLTGKFNPIKIIPGVIDLLTDEQLQALLDDNFIEKDQRVGAYTNNRVNDYNDYIRGTYQTTHEFQVGEILVNNSALRLKNAMLSAEEEVEITEVASTISQHPIDDEISLDVRLMSFRTKFKGEHKGVPVPVDRNYYNELIKYYGSIGKYVKYFYLKNTFPDLRPRNASTLHKLQGSSHDNIFIDLTDLSSCRNPDLAARLLYVAVSRARNRVYFYGKLADKYGGLTY